MSITDYKEPKEDKKKNREERVNFVLDKIENHPLNGKTYENMAKYLAFYNGFHYIDMPTDYIDGDDLMHRSKINTIQMNCDITVSNLLKDIPVVSATPTGDSEQDRKAARTATKLLSYAFDQNYRNLMQHLYSVETMAYVMGTGYWYVFWNPHMYSKVRGNKKSESLNKGDWDLTVHDPFDVLMDPSAKEHRQVRWAILRSYIDIDVAKATYKDKLKGKNISEASSNEIEQLRYSKNTEEYLTSSEMKKNMALHVIYWEIPSDEYPKGRKIVVVGDQLAFDGDNDNLEYGDKFAIPLIPFWWNKNGWSFLGNSAVKDQIPIQKEINLLGSIIMENARMMASTTICVPKGSGIKYSDLSGRPKYIESNPTYGAMPTELAGVGLPGYVPAHLQTLYTFGKDVSSVHQVSQAQVPDRGSHIPASALKMLMDSEAVRHAPSMRCLQSSLKMAAEFILAIIKKRYNEKRYVTIMGDGYKYEIEAFDKSDLEGNFDIILRVTSSISSSPAAKVETVLQLADRKIFESAEAGQKWAMKILKILEFGDTEKITREESLDDNYVTWWFNTLVETKKVPEIFSFTPADKLIERLSSYGKTQEFQDETPEMQDVILGAIQVLEQNQAANQQGQQQPPVPGGEMQQPPMGPEGAMPPPEAMPPSPDGMDQAAAMSMGGQGGIPV